MCGPTPQEKELAASQQGFMNELQGAFATNYGKQSSIYQNITNTMTPIEEAGPDQQGYSAQELAALNTGAINSTGAATANAEQRTANANAGHGDGSGLESGVDKALESNIATTGADTLANEQNNITQGNYAQGNKNFQEASQALGSVAAGESPAAFGSEANTAGEDAFKSADTIQQQNQELSQDILGAVESGGTDLATVFKK
jgi:hypothetical protein